MHTDLVKLLKHLARDSTPILILESIISSFSILAVTTHPRGVRTITSLSSLAETLGQQPRGRTKLLTATNDRWQVYRVCNFNFVLAPPRLRTKRAIFGI